MASTAWAHGGGRSRREANMTLERDSNGRPEDRPQPTSASVRSRDAMPMFTVTNAVDSHRIHYGDIWQRKNLVLVITSESDPTSAAYAETIIAAAPRLASVDTVVIVTRDAIAGIQSPAVVIADRWGEIYYVTHTARAADLPSPDDILEWLEYVQNQCPECQGEAR